jgi:hypothetical protein
VTALYWTHLSFLPSSALSLSSLPHYLSPLPLIHFTLPPSSPYSSLERPPVMRLYRLPPPLSIYTSSTPACVLQSVLYDTLTNDFKLTETIATLPPPVIEVSRSAFCPPSVLLLSLTVVEVRVPAIYAPLTPLTAHTTLTNLTITLSTPFPPAHALRCSGFPS